MTTPVTPILIGLVIVICIVSIINWYYNGRTKHDTFETTGHGENKHE